MIQESLIGAPIVVLPAITLWDPWGTLMALEEKLYETRSWPTKHRGWMAIHVASRWSTIDQGVCFRWPPYSDVLAKHGFHSKQDMPLGCVVGVGRLVGVHRVEDVRDELSDQELAFGNYADGRFAWEFRDMQRLAEPVPATGRQRVWTWRVPDDTAIYLNLHQ